MKDESLLLLGAGAAALLVFSEPLGRIADTAADVVEGVGNVANPNTWAGNQGQGVGGGTWTSGLVNGLIDSSLWAVGGINGYNALFEQYAQNVPFPNQPTLHYLPVLAGQTFAASGNAEALNEWVFAPL